MAGERKALEESAAPVVSHAPEVWYTSGCDLLDLVVGGGLGMGFPGGYIVNFVGDKSAGKTALSVEMLVANKVRYGKDFNPNHDDAESGYTFDTQRMYGVDLYEGKEPRKSQTVEEMDANVGLWLDGLGKRGKGIYVVDSLDGLSNEDQEDRADERKAQLAKGDEVHNKGSYGMGTPKFLSQDFFPTKATAIQNANALLIIVSQVRENLNAGMFGKKLKRSGGKALDFYAHTAVWLATVRKIVKKVNGEERVVGVLVEARTEKSKTPRPYRSCRFSFYFDYGIDNTGTGLDFLFDLRTPEGELSKAAEAVAWRGKSASFKEILDWLKKVNLYEVAQDEKRRQGQRAVLSAEWVGDWIREDPDRKALFEAEFGVSMTREALIREIDNNPEMRAELKERVIAKWEAIEASMKTDRPPKYALKGGT